MVWVTSFWVQTWFTHSLLLITRTKSRTETALTSKVPNLFPELHTDQLKEAGTCTFFTFVPSLSAGGCLKVGHRAAGPRGREGGRLSELSKDFPSSSSPGVAVVAHTPLLTVSPAVLSWLSRAAGYCGVCISLPDPFSRAKKKKSLCGATWNKWFSVQ